MKDRVEVKNVWGYRIFIIQIISILLSIILSVTKLVGINISWKMVLSPILISIGIPFILLLLLVTITGLIFSGVYLLSDKEKKSKLIQSIKKIKWKRS